MCLIPSLLEFGVVDDDLNSEDDLRASLSLYFLDKRRRLGRSPMMYGNAERRFRLQ